MTDLKPPPDTSHDPAELLKEDSEGSDDNTKDNSFVGADMVDSLGAGVPEYETTGEEGVLDGPGVPGYQTTGEVEPNDETEQELDAQQVETPFSTTPKPK